MSKDLFLQLREQEIATMYENTFSKKDAILTGKRMVDNLIENGNVNKHEFSSGIFRMFEVLQSAVIEIRKHLPHEAYECNGMTFTPVEGGNTINYSECKIYCTLKSDLDARVELLKLAQKQPMIDLYGNDVPRVGTTPRKSSVTIKY